MKFVFTSDERAKLDEIMRAVMSVASKHKEEDGGKSVRTLKKMQYKFSPAGEGSVAYLGKKERDFLAFMVRSRIEAAIVPAMEFTLKGIAEKLDQ